MQQFINTLQSLVATNRTKLALAILSDFFAQKQPDLHQQTLMYQATLSKAERDFTTGVATRNEVQQNIAKVNVGLLSMLEEIPKINSNEIEEMERAKQIASSFKELEFVPQSTEKQSNLLWIGAFGVLILTAVMMWFTFFNVETVIPKSTQIAQTVPVKQVKTIAEQKTESDAWRKSAEDIAKQGQWSKALVTINKAFGMGFDNAELYNQRADILLHLSRYSEARDDAQRTIALNANFCWGYVTLAQASSKIGNEEGFYTNIETALRKNCEVWKYTQQIGLFEYQNKPRFKNLIKKYQ
jgi:tetratricopeptide (TPR) repeat protein